MDVRGILNPTSLVVLFGWLCSMSEGASHKNLTCFQCNIFVRGSPWPCDSDRGMKQVSGCHACLKTFTRTYLHNTFFDNTYTSFESRVCVKDRDYVKSDGCHPHQSASGYMKRCFCSDHLCNTGNDNRHGYGFVLFTLLFMSKWWMRAVHDYN